LVFLFPKRRYLFKLALILFPFVILYLPRQLGNEGLEDKNEYYMFISTFAATPVFLYIRVALSVCLIFLIILFVKKDIRTKIIHNAAFIIYFYTLFSAIILSPNLIYSGRLLSVCICIEPFLIMWCSNRRLQLGYTFGLVLSCLIRHNYGLYTTCSSKPGIRIRR